MNITFFIGNGFDRNLGLATTYQEFVKEYKKDIPNKPMHLKLFKESIKNNEPLWKNAEIEMGQYTDKFETGEASLYSDCHTDFCEHLAEYLKSEEQRIDFNCFTDAIKKAFSSLNEIDAPFRSVERQTIHTTFSAHNSESITFNFVCFNYTRTLDMCKNAMKEDSFIIGFHEYGTQRRMHRLGDICHVHGTVDGQMVFGVNDESQIAKKEIFDCEYGEIYKDTLIKIQANAAFLENTDEKARNYLEQSNIIYVYGMALGETDKLWWERICEWLSKNSNRQLILQKHSLPKRGETEIDYRIATEKHKDYFVNMSSLDQGKKDKIKAQIHVTSYNIFENIKNIAHERVALQEKELQLV